jgi:glycosyltransferase involved in cell wall biosynthesis
MPRFSIIITSRNQPDFIRHAVNSALAQTYRDREVIVVDDASSDNSLRILEEYGDSIRLIKLDENVGASRARNIGIEAAQGEYLAFLDGDDLLLPWALAVYREVLEQQEPHIILGAMLWFESKVPEIDNERTPKNLKVVAFESLLEKDRPYRASASALVISRDVFSGVQGWSNEIFPMEDLDVLIKLLDSGRTTQILSPATVGYRMHSGNTIHQISNCAGALRAIMEKEKRGGYSSGRARRGQRYAFLGGPALFWMRKAYRSGLYTEAARLFLSGWPMIFAAAMRRATVLIAGRQPAVILPLRPTNNRF